MKTMKFLVAFFLIILSLCSCSAKTNKDKEGNAMVLELESISVSKSGDMMGGHSTYRIAKTDDGVFLIINSSPDWRTEDETETYKCSEDILRKIQAIMIEERLWKIREIKDKRFVPDEATTRWVARISGKTYNLFSGQMMSQKYSKKFSKISDIMYACITAENLVQSTE